MVNPREPGAETPIHGPHTHVTVEGVEPHPHRTGHRLIDLLLGGSAILISCISLFIAVQHGRTMQQLVAANSWPLLKAGSGNTENGRPIITMAIENVGVGPAIVRNFYAKYQGRQFTNAHDFLKLCCGEVPVLPEQRFAPGGEITSPIDRTVIKSGDYSIFLAIERAPRSEAVWRKLDKERFNISYYACYCSVFGQCWESDLTGIEQREVKACPMPKQAPSN